MGIHEPSLASIATTLSTHSKHVTYIVVAFENDGR